MRRKTLKKGRFIIVLSLIIGILVFPIGMQVSVILGGAHAVAADQLSSSADANLEVTQEKGTVEFGRAVYYKTEGIVSGKPAAKTINNLSDYPRYGNFESRELMWIANQQHLYYGSFVLAVPIFCMILDQGRG